MLFPKSILGLFSDWKELCRKEQTLDMWSSAMQMVLSSALTLDTTESLRLFLWSSARFWSKARVPWLSFKQSKNPKSNLLFIRTKKLNKFNKSILFIILWGENEGEKPQMDLAEPGDTTQLHFSILLIWLNSYCKRLQR